MFTLEDSRGDAHVSRLGHKGMLSFEDAGTRAQEQEQGKSKCKSKPWGRCKYQRMAPLGGLRSTETTSSPCAAAENEMETRTDTQTFRHRDTRTHGQGDHNTSTRADAKGQGRPDACARVSACVRARGTKGQRTSQANNHGRDPGNRQGRDQESNKERNNSNNGRGTRDTCFRRSQAQ